MRSITAATMAAALVVASVPPAAATNNGLSEKKVRAIVKQEVAKIPRVRGPAGPKGPAGPPGATGPTGPAGMDGSPYLFALVFADGGVHGNGTFGGGITEDNVRVVGRDVEDGGEVVRRSVKYCFTGLPPVTGGQVTLYDAGLEEEIPARGIRAPYLDIFTRDDPDCAPAVYLKDKDDRNVIGDFFILLY